MAARQGTNRRPRALATLAALVTTAIIATMLAPIATAGAARTSGAATAPQVGYVDVSVATVWTDPTKARPVDAPAITNPAHVWQWLKSMTTAQFLNLTDDNRTQTQALYGNRVDILGYQDGWYEVAVPGQPTPKNALGYPGWIPAAQISLDGHFGALRSAKPFALVDKAATVSIYRDAGLTEPYMRIPYDTRLPVLSGDEQAVQVAVPGGGSAYLKAADVSVYRSAADIPYPTGQDLVADAKLFLGHPYLWGGTSGFAFDCSGFTHTLYDAHGITIGRDADTQADFTGHGTRVDRADLRPGDLLFYASASDPTNASTIHHVAMYVGNGRMAEFYGAGVPGRITKVRYGDEYWGAERFLTH